MKIKFQFPVSCRGQFIESLSFPLGDKEIGFIVKDQRFAYLTITAPGVPNHAWPRIAPDTSGMLEIHISDHPGLPWKELKSLVRTIEGGLSFWGVSEIDVEHCTTEWIPESQQEIDALELSQITRSRSTENHTENAASLDMFIRTVLLHGQFSDLEIPLNFYRRGQNEMGRARSLDATYDFSFLLETMFANGKFRQHDVVTEMMASSELTNAIKELSNNRSHFNGIGKDTFAKIESKYLHKPVKEVISAIVALRGFIHHHTMKRTDMWHPEDHDIHEPDAVYLVQLCHFILAGRVIGTLYKPENISAFKALKVTTENGKRIEWVPIEDSDL